MLGSNKNYTIRTVGTIDSGSRGILQNFHRLDIGGVDIVQRTTALRDGNTIDNDVRTSSCVDGVTSTNQCRGSITRNRTALRDIYTSGCALNSLQNVSYGQFAQAFLINRGNRTGHIRLFLNTITYNNHFFKSSSIFFDSDVKALARSETYFLCQIANVRDGKGTTVLHVE